MIKRYNNLSFVFGIPGLVLHFLWIFFRGSEKDSSTARMSEYAAIGGFFLLIIGLGYYAQAKGRHPAWGLLGFMSIIGMVILGLSKDMSDEAMLMRDRDYGRENTELQYAGFWKRFFAMLIDGAVMFPFTVFFIFLEGLSPEIAIFVALPNLALYWFYNIYFHSRWGTTLGKMVTGIIVVKASNYSAISFREAIMRFVVDFIFAIILLVARITALLHISSGEYADLGWQDRSQVISDHSPVWLPMSLISKYFFSLDM